MRGSPRRGLHEHLTTPSKYQCSHILQASISIRYRKAITNAPSECASSNITTQQEQLAHPSLQIFARVDHQSSTVATTPSYHPHTSIIHPTIHLSYKSSPGETNPPVLSLILPETATCIQSIRATPAPILSAQHTSHDLDSPPPRSH